MELSRVCSETLTLVLAGGNGARLFPLTKDRAKPAVPFAGQYRIIDFTLSNCVNSGLRKIYVLTQYMSHSLDRHLKLAWNFFEPAFDEFLLSAHPQFRTKDSWYLGTADAVFQNIHLIMEHRPKRVLILSGDHIYRMNYAEMLQAHIHSGAVITIGGVEIDVSSARRLGVLESDYRNVIVRFQEKPENPMPVLSRPDRAMVNMGVYVFDTEMLIDALCEDALRDSTHDFGKDILPKCVESGSAFVFPFYDSDRNRYHYWRDIGTLDSYYEASMDLIRDRPPFDLGAASLPIQSYRKPHPPARFVRSSDRPGRKPVVGSNSLICNGCIIRGGSVEHSILSPGVCVNPGAQVEESVLFDGVEIGSQARIRRAIIDKEVKIPPRFVVGYNPEEDRKRFTVTDSGIVVIPKRECIEPVRAMDLRHKLHRKADEVLIA